MEPTGFAGGLRAIGFSRGDRAIVGALAEDSEVFDRIALVIPPRGAGAGKWKPWLDSLSKSKTRPNLSAEILVVADRVDADHPLEVAQFWAEQLVPVLKFTNLARCLRIPSR